MTPEELGHADRTATECYKEIIDEVYRLRGLVASAVPCTHCCEHCPWCDGDIYTRDESGQIIPGCEPRFTHEPECPAFTVDGELK